ncbi:Hypothetical predicted protein [Mytilus galloprovincialis]|uniref:Uncharacterized protein n=1 Tax=Mytilus galloprovincialis TaxID=29158 RepID=A0A8B6FY48_MYTGA|nr:Hypothetical predicted protein [Mytilus galloprovincialis]
MELKYSDMQYNRILNDMEDEIQRLKKRTDPRPTIEKDDISNNNGHEQIVNKEDDQWSEYDEIEQDNQPLGGMDTIRQLLY